MLGELEYDELYYPQNKTLNLEFNGTHGSGTIEEETVSQYFPFTAHILVTVFVLLVSIIIMNLLFGLAVTDIQVRIHRIVIDNGLLTNFNPWKKIAVTLNLQYFGLSKIQTLDLPCVPGIVTFINKEIEALFIFFRYVQTASSQ